MVHDWSATTSTPQRHTGDRRHSCFRVVIRPRPRNTCWRRSDDADACAENRVALLLRPPSAAPNSSLSATAYIPVAGGHSGKHATWLRQRRLDRPPGLSYSSPAVSPQRSCAANFQLASLRPCPRRSHQPSLAACSWAHQVKSCHPGLQGPPRLCTVVPCPVHLGCWPSKSPRALLFLQPLPRSASGSPFHGSTVGSRAFSVAGPQVWNCLPPEVTSAPSLTTFRTRRKTFLFTESYPDIRLIWHFVYTLSIVDLAGF